MSPPSRYWRMRFFMSSACRYPPMSCREYPGELTTVSQLVGRERERRVQLCKKRAALWSNTTMALMPMGREESRARANEAGYLADSIGSE